PREVLKMNGRHVQIADRDSCMECGACSRNCPAGAIFVEAGVGCAAAVINGMLGRKDSACCCSVDPKTSSPNKSPGSCC
ncbi:MAG TPA: 4Fe-4S binding protein, partial [Deltaproteobacteria bacterium]|nr:4Fe-4S binding protein [Deltaproteobacteria bacterium]